MLKAFKCHAKIKYLNIYFMKFDETRAKSLRKYNYFYFPSMSKIMNLALKILDERKL